MEDHASEINLKQRNMPDGFKDIISLIAAVGNSRDNLEKEDWLYPECALFKGMKMHILMYLNEHILKEIESIRNLGSKYSELAVGTSARKLLALPEMESIMCDLKEGLDEMLENYILSSRFETSSEDSQKSGRNPYAHEQTPWACDSSISISEHKSKNYIRLPVALIEEVIGGMVELTTYSPEEFRVISPLNLLSVIDPKALWMKTCFYYTRIRNILFKKLSKTQHVSIILVKGIVSWLNRVTNRNKRTSLNDDVKQVIDKNHVKFALFSHSLHLYSFFMDYDKGRNLLWNVDGGVSYQEILRCIISYLNHSFSCQTTSLLLKVLHSLISSVKNGVLTNNFVYDLVLNPLISAYRSFDSESDMIIQPYVIDLAQALLKSKVGRDKFLVQKFYFESSDANPVKILLLYASNSLKSGKGDLDLLKSALTACISLSFSPKGLIEIEDSDLISTLGVFYRQLKGVEYSSTLKSMSPFTLPAEDRSKLELLASCIICFIAYSGRVWLIERESILFSVLSEMFKQPVIPWNQFWFKKFLVSSSLTSSGYDAVARENLQPVLLGNLWKFRMLDNNDLSDQIEENLQYELSKIFCLCSTLRGVKATLLEQEGSDVTLTEEPVSPSSIQEVLELTLSVNRDSSGNITLMEEMPNYTDSNEVYLGLRLLRFMMSNLDVTLLLQHKYFVQEHLMMICNGNLIEDKGELVIDDITLMCDQILRNSFLVDYSNEKNYLSRNMAMRSAGIMQPRNLMTSSVSHLEQYSGDWVYNSHHRSHSRHTPRRLKNDLIKFLGSTRHGLRDVNWLNQLRKVHRSIFIGSNSPDLKNNIMVDLLEEVQKAYANINSNGRSVKLQWSENSLYSLFPEDLHGIKLAIRFGAKLNLLQPTLLVHSNLAQFIRSTYGALKIVRDEFWGFDWFLASVFLLCCGNIDRCQQFINNFVKINVAPFVWATFGEVISKFNSTNNNYKNDYIFLLIQQVELILSLEVPKVFAAFQSSSASVGVLVHQWISQCFFNILDWSQMKNFMCLVMINEPDYIVYFCVALFVHLEPFILRTVATSAEHLWEQIKINPVCHFHLGNYLYFIEKIHKIHHNSVMRSISKCTADLNKYQ